MAQCVFVKYSIEIEWICIEPKSELLCSLVKELLFEKILFEKMCANRKVQKYH